MKTIVNNYIYNSFDERGMKSFEKKVATILKLNNITGFVICHNAWKERGLGYCQYFDCIEIEVNGEDYCLRQKTNDSLSWDSWEHPTSKDKRNLFLAVLEDQIIFLKDMILENNN